MTGTCITTMGDVRHTEGCAATPHPCDHHADTTATHTNASESAHIHFLSVWFYCAACADEYLTDYGRRIYGRDDV